MKRSDVVPLIILGVVMLLLVFVIYPILWDALLDFQELRRTLP